MGYNSELSGELIPDVPIRHSELPGNLRSFDGTLRVRLEESRVPQSEGVLLVLSGVAIEPAVSDKCKMYRLAEELADLLERLPPRQWTGELERQGEDAEDAEQITVLPGSVVAARRPERVWGPWTPAKRQAGVDK